MRRLDYGKFLEDLSYIEELYSKSEDSRVIAALPILKKVHELIETSPKTRRPSATAKLKLVIDERGDV